MEPVLVGRDDSTVPTLTLQLDEAAMEPVLGGRDDVLALFVLPVVV